MCVFKISEGMRVGKVLEFLGKRNVRHENFALMNKKLEVLCTWYILDTEKLSCDMINSTDVCKHYPISTYMSFDI